MGVSVVQLLVILLIILLLFGAGKLPKVMSELGKGLKSFKSSMKDDDNNKDKDKDQKPAKDVQKPMRKHICTCEWFSYMIPTLKKYYSNL